MLFARIGWAPRNMFETSWVAGDCAIMGLRYRRRLTLFPGFSVNLGKSGLTSVSVGIRGAHYTVGRRGPRATIGLPGTRLSYTVSPHRHRRRPAARHYPILGMLILLFLLYVGFRVLAGI